MEAGEQRALLSTTYRKSQTGRSPSRAHVGRLAREERAIALNKLVTGTKLVDLRLVTSAERQRNHEDTIVHAIRSIHLEPQDRMCDSQKDTAILNQRSSPDPPIMLSSREHRETRAGAVRTVEVCDTEEGRDWA